MCRVYYAWSDRHTEQTSSNVIAVAQYYYAMRLKNIDGISMTSYHLIKTPIIVNPAYSL